MCMSFYFFPIRDWEQNCTDSGSVRTPPCSVHPPPMMMRRRCRKPWCAQHRPTRAASAWATRCVRKHAPARVGRHVLTCRPPRRRARAFPLTLPCRRALAAPSYFALTRTRQHHSTHTRARTHTHTHTPTRARARARTHTHTQKHANTCKQARAHMPTRVGLMRWRALNRCARAATPGPR